jgi:hypothetical protein
MFVMSVFLLNYLCLVLAMLLPNVGFYALPLQHVTISLSAWLAVGLSLAVALRLVGMAPERIGYLRKHARIQTWVLLMIIMGGIMDSFRVLLHFDQFRQRLDIGSVLQVLMVGVWLFAAWLVLRGLVALLLDRS